MTRAKLSFLAAAWLLAAHQVEAGPIATAGDNAATSSELASLGGLLQALGAGVIGNGALLYPTAASSHQRAEAEILASDTATRVLKKVKSILKDGGINDDEDGGDESSHSVTYLVKPALIFHKEELPPPNPLAGNVLPLPGGALLYTPTPTAGANGEPTSGPAASIKAAYGNLFAASPYTPSYTLNKPHAAVIVEEVTDMISLKSMQQRLEDAGEDEGDDDDEDEDEYGRKKKGKKTVKFVSLETIDSTSAFVNPFTRADFPFGLMTPPAVPTSTEVKSTSHKTIKKTLTAKLPSPSSTSTGVQLNASLGKDGGITVVANNLPQATSTSAALGTTIVIPQASLMASSASSASSASPASSATSSASPASSSSISIHEESSKNDDLKANEIARHAHTSSAKVESDNGTSVKGNRRDEVMSFDPLAMSTSGASPAAKITDLAQATNMHEAAESPVGTVGSSAESSASPASETGKHRKMHVVRVFEVKNNKSSLISGASSSHSSASAAAQSTSSAEHMQKRDMMPLYDAPESTSMLETNPMETPLLIETYSTEAMVMPTEPARMAPSVSNWQRMAKESANDNDSESDSDDDGGKKLDSDAEKISEILSKSKENVSPTAEASSSSPASVESSSASVSADASSVSGDIKVEAMSAESASPNTSVQSTSSASAQSSSASAQSSSASAQSSSASAQSSSASAQSSSASVQSSSASAKKSGTTTMMTSPTSRTVASTSTRSPLSIEDVGAQETSVEKDSVSEDARSGKKDDSDSDSDSESESGVEKANERDASEEGDSDEDSNESEMAKDEDDEDDEKASPRSKVGSKERLAIVHNDEDPLAAIQRVAAMGLREAEKAVEEFEENSEAPDVEVLTTQDEKPESSSSAEAAESATLTATAAAIPASTESIAPAQLAASKSVASALSLAMSSLDRRAAEATASPVRVAAHKDRDDDSDDDKDSDDEKRSKKEDSDDDSDSDSDSDDSDDDKKKKKNKSSKRGSDKTNGNDRQMASKALSEAAAESVQQVVHATSTMLDAMGTDSASADFTDESNAERMALSEAASESEKQAVSASATELDNMATDSASADFTDEEKAESTKLSSKVAAAKATATATKLTSKATRSVDEDRAKRMALSEAAA
ncbi:hypothetical protein GGI21_002183, partial [Coemansia aciculifera]